jgi:hypothetical protein
MAQSQLESTKMLCESLQSSGGGSSELLLIKAGLERMKDKIEEIDAFKLCFILWM